MLKIVVREILIFLVCITVFPLLTLSLLGQHHSYSALLGMALREVFLGLGYSEHGFVTQLMRLVTPYALLQAVRAYGWSQASLVGRRWAHAYYATILFIMGTWLVLTAWDLFRFMYALGDIPAELVQFVELEGLGLIIGIGSYILCLYCLRTALNPSKPPPKLREM